MIPPMRKVFNAGRRLTRTMRRSAVLARMRVVPPPGPALVVCGSPRGGTTWIGSRLADATGSLMIFEPLHPRATAAGQHGFGWGDYLPADGLTGSRAEWLDAVLGGRAVNWWMAEDQPLRVAVAARSILVKSVRANGLLDALDHSRACLDPLVVVRHPVATVASQLAEGSWRHPESIDLSGFLRLWPEHADAIAAARRPEEYLTPRIGF